MIWFICILWRVMKLHTVKKLFIFFFNGISNNIETEEVNFTVDICLGDNFDHIRDFLPYFTLGSRVTFRIVKITNTNDIDMNTYTGTVTHILVNGQVHIHLTIENDNY